MFWPVAVEVVTGLAGVEGWAEAWADSAVFLLFPISMCCVNKPAYASTARIGLKADTTWPWGVVCGSACVVCMCVRVWC